MISGRRFLRGLARAVAGFFLAALSTTVLGFSSSALVDAVNYLAGVTLPVSFAVGDRQDVALSRGLDLAIVAVILAIAWLLFVRHRSRAFAAGAIVGILLWIFFWAIILYISWYAPDA